MKLSRRKFFAFAFTAMSLSVIVALVLLLIADLFVHSRAERTAGLNRWVSRTVRPEESANSRRHAVRQHGFGYGVQWYQRSGAARGVLSASRPFR